MMLRICICICIALAASALAGCAAPAEDDDSVVVLPDDMGRDGGLPDMLPADAGPDLGAPARVLVERAPLPFPTDNRFVNPGFDPRSPSSWISDPIGIRIADHRLPFDGPGLLLEPAGEQGVFFGRVRLSAHPIELSIWVGISPGDVPTEEAHRGRVLVQFDAYTPDRDPIQPITYSLLPAGEPVVGPRNLVWQRYTGGTRRPTLGWGWLVIAGARDQRLAIGGPRAVLEEVDPAALRIRAPAMPIVTPDPARIARLKARDLRPLPRTPRPVSAGPRGFPAIPAR